MRLNRILRCIKPCLSNKISCSQCKFYNPDKTCKMYNEIDIVTLNIKNSLAESCREDETKCGSKAVFYREKTKKEIEEEDDKEYWNDIKYPILSYFLFLFAVHMYEF